MVKTQIAKLNNLKVILASASPRRQSALKSLGLKFEVVPSTFTENYDKATFHSPKDYVLATAKGKGEEVFSRLSAAGQKPDLVISADTIVVRDNDILEKPETPEEAKKMIQSLCARAHNVLTAVYLRYANDKDNFEFIETTEVHFGQFVEEDVDAYIASGSPLDKAGAYGIQDPSSAPFLSHINGCFWNVTGFPLYRFCHLLDNPGKQQQ
eukprot:TRINITY_DN719_c0_g1_i1.p1 TRINITY_DN719_c0_g1~~TRINITY_DN719_c0_g1_i1.p1  ORF type:complete len:210 (-),score=69.40 TRINITY_DN719_c0_g1_i1:68-697(-)